jgi:hypothetical protein
MAVNSRGRKGEKEKPQRRVCGVDSGVLMSMVDVSYLGRYLDYNQITSVASGAFSGLSTLITL